MPRFDGNTRSRKARHHKAMNSAAHGKGHSAKQRLAKRHDGDHRESCKICGRPESRPK